MKISVWIYFLLRCDAMRLMDFHSHLWFLMIGIDIGSSALRVISSFQVMGNECGFRVVSSYLSPDFKDFK